MRTLAIVLTLIVSAGCASGPDSTVPPTPTVNFDKTVTENGTSVSRHFTWTNPQSQAKVVMWSNLTQGNVLLRMFDPNGVLTFEKRYTTESAQVTLSTRGAPGAWSIVAESQLANATWHVVVSPWPPP